MKLFEIKISYEFQLHKVGFINFSNIQTNKDGLALLAWCVGKMNDMCDNNGVEVFNLGSNNVKK